MEGLSITNHSKNLVLDKPILIEGLPGIGNVGKVAVDFIIDQTKAKKIYSFFSYSFPHSVFVNEDNLVELPSIEIYHKKINGNDFLFLSGDVQPIDEKGSYEFTDKVLDLVQGHNVKEVITLGGIGLRNIPQNPKIYCTANSKKIIQRYKKGVVIHDSLYGVVGPIVGVSGIMLGLAKQRNIEAISFLAETYGHPMYIGIKGAKEIINLLNKKLSLGVNLNKLDEDIKELESEHVITRGKKPSVLRKLKDRLPKGVDYIG